MAEIGESGVLPTKRARQIATAGMDMLKGGLMPEELLDLLLNGVSGFIGTWRQDLGNGVERHFLIHEIDDEGWVEFEVLLKRAMREPGPRYRLTLKLEELPEES